MMIDLDLNKAQLAKGAKIHINTIGKEGPFRSDTVDRIAYFLGCKTFDLITDDGQPPAARTSAKRKKGE